MPGSSPWKTCGFALPSLSCIHQKGYAEESVNFVSGENRPRIEQVSGGKKTPYLHNFLEDIGFACKDVAVDLPAIFAADDGEVGDVLLLQYSLESVVSQVSLDEALGTKNRRRGQYVETSLSKSGSFMRASAAMAQLKLPLKSVNSAMSDMVGDEYREC